MNPRTSILTKRTVRAAPEWGPNWRQTAGYQHWLWYPSETIRTGSIHYPFAALEHYQNDEWSLVMFANAGTSESHTAKKQHDLVPHFVAWRLTHGI